VTIYTVVNDTPTHARAHTHTQTHTHTHTYINAKCLCVCARACVYIYQSKVKRHCIEKRKFLVKNAVSIAPFPTPLCTNTNKTRRWFRVIYTTVLSLKYSFAPLAARFKKQDLLLYWTEVLI